jgi:predicted acylesterase/phospholipase RssA/CRP-like cAMP-binding protein
MTFDQHWLGIELLRLDWARELSDEVIQDIVATAGIMEYQAGEVVIELDSDAKSIIFVITGWLEAALYDRIGKEVRRDTFRRGSVVGLFSALLPGRSYLHVKAAEHTTAIRFGLADLLRLTAKHREFQLAMLRIGAGIAKYLVMIDRDLPRPAAVAVVHHSDASRPLAAELARRLRQLGESPCVAGDDGRWRPEEGIPYRLIFEDGVSIGLERLKQLLKEWASHYRFLIDFRTEHSPDDLVRMLHYSDTVLWCLRPRDVEAALRTLKAVEPAVPRLREKVCLVWVLDHDTPAPPYVQELYEFAARDFKTYSGGPRPKQGRLLQQGVERIVHHLRGVRIGLVLGGGAARGMAHLGVLKALEQHGIFVDMLAGTSAGAMVSGLYAAGLDPGYVSDSFKKDLMPSWLFRLLPGGGYWYLLYKYRSGQFGPMLRKYLGDLRMEQLAIPVIMISVDLVDGVPLVRDRGDATNNILESINLPPLSLPIFQQNQAVVDGGLLNNVPANELVARGCNFVIASTVTAQLEKDFMGIRSKKRPGFSSFITSIQVIMRQYMIQGHSMNAVGVEPADFVIAPDVTSFDLSEFTRADEMAVIGEETTNASVHRLKAMLSRLDPKLFPC